MTKIPKTGILYKPPKHQNKNTKPYWKTKTHKNHLIFVSCFRSAWSPSASGDTSGGRRVRRFVENFSTGWEGHLWAPCKPPPCQIVELSYVGNNNYRAGAFVPAFRLSKFRRLKWTWLRCLLKACKGSATMQLVTSVISCSERLTLLTGEYEKAISCYQEALSFFGCWWSGRGIQADTEQFSFFNKSGCLRCLCWSRATCCSTEFYEVETVFIKIFPFHKNGQWLCLYFLNPIKTPKHLTLLTSTYSTHQEPYRTPPQKSSNNPTELQK